jgi:hypothetical protein
MKAVFVLFDSLNRHMLGPYGGTRVPTPICGTAPEASAFSKRWRNGNGAVICSASHEGFSVKSRVRVQVEALVLQAFRCKPHIRQDDVPPLSFIRTKELQAGGTTLFERRLSAKPNNGAAPLNLEARARLELNRREADQICDFKTAPSGKTPFMA